MPRISSEPFSFDCPRRFLLLDTNVLMAYFLPNDPFHEDCQIVLDEIIPENYQGVGILNAVLVECWGMIVGKSSRPDIGLRLFDWVSNIGNRAIVIPSSSVIIQGSQRLVRELNVDYVDALLMFYATSLTNQLGESVSICSLDRRDLYKRFERRDLALEYRVFNPETLETI